MIENLKAWAATGAGGVGWWASLNLVTDLLQFLTAVVALASTSLGFWLFFQKWRDSRKP